MRDVDVVVIGSGAGGLAAAVALARAGQKVVVLEQHYLPGGWCHSFSLDQYRFSPGVHYLGELGEGGRLRRLYEGLGVAGDLTFFELNPDGFDHVLFDHERFDLPKGKEALAERLSGRFFAERAGIEAYLDDVETMAHELDEMLTIERVSDALRLPFKAPTVARWGLRSAQSLIDHHVRDPKLRALLGAQAGDHGMPPSAAPAAVHASVINHYFGGGYYPKGGGGAIPRAFIRALRRAGGSIRVRSEVSRILIEDGRAIGVRLSNGEEIRAGAVVSNADPQVTYGRLVGEEHLPPLERLRLRRSRWSVSALSLFLAVDMDLRAAGMDSGNVWYFRGGDVDGTYRKGLTAWGAGDGPIPGGFLTATTLKDPTKRYEGGTRHTLESFAFVSYEAFERWSDTRDGQRPASYQKAKEALLGRMLELVSSIVPGIDRHVAFAELGTPLTNVHYCASSFGNLYGTEKSRFQVGPFAHQVRSPIKGLYLCGASTLSHGVMGAHLSGMVAASQIARVRMSDLLKGDGQSVTIYPSEGPPPPSLGHDVGDEIEAEAEAGASA